VELEPAEKGNIAAAGSPGKACPEQLEFPTPQQFRWAAVLLLGYFGLRLLFLANTISPFLPPDERTHFGICTIFADYLFLPPNSPDSYEFGLVTNIPWLYYWILGKLVSLNFFSMSNLLFLRLCNIPLAFGVVYYTWRLGCLLTRDRLTQLLLITAATNTMMLSFLSAFVSYDNLANLLAIMAIYYLFAFFKERVPDQLALALLCLMAGCLAKITMLPLVLALGVVLFLHEFRNLGALPGWLAVRLRRPRPRGVLLAVALVAGFALNLQLYGGNYLEYRKLSPEMTDVLPIEQAMQFRLAARNHILELYRSGQATREKALEMTSQINHPGDRADAVFMINNYAEFKQGLHPMVSFPAYIPLWTMRMAAGVFGIFAHIPLPTNWPLIAPIALLAALTLVALVVRWRPRDADGFPTQLMAVSMFYALFFLYQVNFKEYLTTGAPFLALHGRYIFPVLGPIYAVSSLYLLQLSPTRGGRLALWGLAMAIFLVCDFPLFLARITPEWTYWPN
jgi:hypothetical protein